MKWMETTTFCCDWLNIVVDLPNVDFVLQTLSNILGVSSTDWIPNDKGLHFYKYSYRLNATAGDVSLSGNAIIASFTPVSSQNLSAVATSYSPDHPQHGILLSFSGDGLRWIRSVAKKEKELYTWLCSVPHNATRVDMAMDIVDPNNDLISLYQSFALKAYNPDKGDYAISGINRSDNYVKLDPVFDRDLGTYTNNVRIGERSSTKGHCLVYNKKVEVATRRGVSDFAKLYYDSVGCTASNYWWRVEYRAKGDFADRVFHLLCYEGDISAFLELCNNLFRFVIVRYLDHHISNGDTPEIWACLIDWLTLHKSINFVEQYKSKQPYVTSNLARQDHFAERNLATLAFNDWLRNIRPSVYDERCQRGRDILKSRGITFDSLLSYLDKEYSVDSLNDLLYF